TAPEVTASLKYGILQNSLTNGLTPSHNDLLSVTGGAGPEFSYSGTLSYTYSGQWQPDLFNRMYGVSIGLTHTRGSFIASGSVSSTLGSNGTYLAGYGPLNIAKVGLGEEENGHAGSLGHSGRKDGSSSQTQALNMDYRQGTIVQHHLTIGRSQTNFD